MKLKSIWLIIFIINLMSLPAGAQLVDVSLTRGTASVSLPITTIQSGDLNAPVGISYSSGMKVNAAEGNAGVGWNLSGAGAVVREVRGLPDDYVGSVSSSTDLRKGWLHGGYAPWPRNFTPAADDDYSVCSDEWSDWVALNALGYKQDTEPDIFYFFAPGLQGQFIFNNYRSIKTIPYQDIKIDVTRGADSLINEIIITNNLGRKYTFQAGDKVTRQAYPMKSTAVTDLKFTTLHSYLTPATFYRSWNLTGISSPAGAAITFTYDNPQQSYEPDFNRGITYGNSFTDTTFVVLDLASSKKINSIVGSNKTATFGWNGSTLNSIVISEGSYASSEKYNLIYAHVGSTSTNPVAMRQKRNFLVGLYKEVNCNVFPGYKFEYHGINLSTNLTDLPFGTDLKQDMFGYYNGTGTSLVPMLYYNNEAQNAEFVRLSPATDYSLMIGSTNRQVDTAKVYFGSIKKVIYPSGGYDLVRYESASYYDDLTDASVNGGGPRVRSVKTSGGDPASDLIRNYKYVLTNGKSSGRWTYKPIFALTSLGYVGPVPENLAPETTLLYSRVEVMTTGRGRSVFEFRNKGMYPQLSDGDYRVSRTRYARPELNYCLSLYAEASYRRYYSSPNAPNTNYDFERELPVKRSDYAIDGKLVSRKLYTYRRTSQAPDSVVGLRLMKIVVNDHDIIIYSKYRLLSHVANTVLLEKTKLYDQTSGDTTRAVETVNKYVLNSNQMLQQIKSINSAGDSIFQIYKYAKDYAGTGTDTQSTMINGLVSANRHGTLVETTTKAGSVYTGGSLTLFNNTFGGSRILPSQQLILGSSNGFTASTVTGSSFVYSSGYLPVRQVDAYDNIGNVLTSRDRARNTRSVIMGHNKTFPVLEILNARNDQVVFTDFEPNISTSLTYTGSLSTSEVYSGRKSLTLTSSNQVSQTGVSKGGTYYRFSCWVKGSSNATISVSINSGAANTVSYTTSGWKYLERRVDMSAVSSTFSFVLTTSATVYIDNITFYPESADVVTHAYEPLNGKTGDLDDRGGAAFQEFDSWGRPHFVRNVDKDIVSIRDYGYKNPGILLPNTNFTHNLPLDSVFIGSTVLFSISDACFSPVTYAWYVNDTLRSSASTLSYQFNVNKDNYIRLEANSSGLTNSRVMMVHPLPHISSVTLDLAGANTHFTCQDLTGEAGVTAVITGSFDPAQTKYEWYYIKNGVRTGLSFTTSNEITFHMDMGAHNYLYCTVHAKKFNLSTGNYDFLPLVTSPVQFFEWIRDPPCPNGW